MASTKNQTTNIRQLFEKLHDVELEIKTDLGPSVFDYLFLFSRTKSINVSIPSLSVSAQKHLQDYVSIGKQILSFFQINLRVDNLPLTDQFLDISHEIYLLRFLQAKQVYPDYNLVRIMTQVERVLLNSNPENTTPTETFNLRLIEELVIDDFGSVDIEQTLIQEQQTHAIASLLSRVPDIKEVSTRFLEDFKEITFKGMVEYVYGDELKLISQQIADECMKFFSKKVYEYLDSNLSVKAAKENVIDYHQRLIQPPATKFPEQLKALGQDVVQILNDNFKSMEDLNEDSRKVITQEFIELTLLYITEGEFIPYNYYILDFRSPEEFSTEEESYNFIIDTYLYYEEGGYSQIPMESYDLDFTPDAKAKIFEAVTNQIENPYFTLNDYLNE